MNKSWLLILFALAMGCAEPQPEGTRYTFPDGMGGWTRGQPCAEIHATYPVVVNKQHIVQVQERDHFESPRQTLVMLSNDEYHHVIETPEEVVELQRGADDLITLHQVCLVPVYVDTKGNALPGQGDLLEKYEFHPYGSTEEGRWEYLKHQIEANP
jgi:hypothetical protein